MWQPENWGYKHNGSGSKWLYELAQFAGELWLEHFAAAESVRAEWCHEELKPEQSVGVGSAEIEESQFHFGE
jgi:hypothetical protein